MMQEVQRIIAQKYDHGPVYRRRQVKRISEEGTDPVFMSDERDGEKLHNV